MRVLHTVFAILLGAVVATAPALGGAPDSSAAPSAMTLGKGSVLTLEGTSTVHDFECRTTEVEFGLGAGAGGEHPDDAAGLAALIRSSGVGGVVVRVPVNSLRSGKATLDKNLRRAMRAEEYPYVRFQLARYTPEPAAAPGDTVGIRAEGTLTIAGSARPITLEARACSAGEGVWLEGSYALRMSDYGIRPPTMMLGTLRVNDRITVRYRLLLIPKGEAAGSPLK